MVNRLIHRFVNKLSFAFVLPVFAYANSVNTVTANIDDIGQMDVETLTWGASTRSSAGRPTAVLLGDIQWSSPVDESAPAITRSFLTGKHIVTTDHEVARSGNSRPAPYLSIVTKNTLVSALTFSEDHMSVATSYESVTLRYDPQARGLTGRVLEATYDTGRGIGTGTATNRATAFVGVAPAADPGGATSIYVRWGGAIDPIAGESQTAGYENWSRIDTLEWGGQIVAVPNRPGSTMPILEDLAWTQALEGSDVALATRMFRAVPVSTVTVEYVKDAGAGPVTFMQYVLGDVLVSDLEFTVGAAAAARVDGKLNVGSFRQTVWSILEDGTRGEAISFGYDYITRKEIVGPSSVTVAGFGSGNLAPTTVAVPSVPEPETWCLLAVGLAMVGGVGLRHKVTM